MGMVKEVSQSDLSREWKSIARTCAGPVQRSEYNWSLWVKNYVSFFCTGNLLDFVLVLSNSLSGTRTVPAGDKTFITCYCPISGRIT